MRSYEYRVIDDTEESYTCEACGEVHEATLEEILNNEHCYGWEPIMMSTTRGNDDESGDPTLLYMVILRRPIRPPARCQCATTTNDESTTKGVCKHGAEDPTNE